MRYALYHAAPRASDEDAMTMMIEAGRACLHGVAPLPDRLALASTSLPGGFAAGLVVTALGLPSETFCLACTTSDRAGTEALLALGTGLVLAADGDWAAAILLGAGDVLAARSSVAAYPGLPSSEVPDYVEMAYRDVVTRAVGDLKGDHVVLNPPIPRLGRGALIAPASGAAGPLVGLCQALERAAPGETVLLVSYGAGSAADAILVRREVG